MSHARTAETLNMPEQEWPEPQPISAMLPTVPALNPLLLPDALRPWIGDVAERMSVPAEMVAIPGLLALATIIAGKWKVQPKQHDDVWIVTPNLWGAVVARPGAKKSDAAKEALKPLRQRDDLAWQQHEKDIAAYRRAKAEYTRAMKANAGVDTISKPATPPEEPWEPIARRLIVNDATSEALHRVLKDNPSGVLLCRDELSGFLRGLEKTGRETDRAFFIETWSGDGSYISDRILRGTQRAHRLCLSIFGTIQPGPLSAYVREAVHGSDGADGLLQRFQLLVWPDASEYRYVDREPDRTAMRQYEHVFDRLDTMSPAKEPLRFASEAQPVFDDWLPSLERSLHESDDDAAIVSHLSKYRSLMPSLAAIFELADRAADGSSNPPGVISLLSAQRATAWCAYLERHAQRVYALGHAGDRSPAATLADKIEAGELESRFTRRDVQRKGWRGLKSETAIAHALATLCECHWLREAEHEASQPGRRPQAYLVNPRIPLGR
jgi:hypothetical protein